MFFGRPRVFPASQSVGLLIKRNVDAYVTRSQPVIVEFGVTRWSEDECP